MSTHPDRRTTINQSADITLAEAQARWEALRDALPARDTALAHYHAMFEEATAGIRATWDAYTRERTRILAAQATSAKEKHDEPVPTG